MTVGPLYNATWLSSLVMLAVVVVLTGGLLLSKGAGAVWGRYAQRREEEYKASILAAISGDAVSLAPVSGRFRRPGDRGIVKDCLLRWAQTVDGFGLKRLCELFIEEGYAADEIRRLGSRRWWMRARAARRLGLMQCGTAVPALVASLNDASMDVRLQAAWALGRLGEVSTVGRIVESLAGDSRLAAQRVASIILALGPQTLPVLETLLENPEREVRKLAIDMLGALKDRRASARVAAILSDADADLRVAACHALGQIGGEAAGVVVKGLDDAQWAVRAKAALVVGQLGLAAAIPKLKLCLRDLAWLVRFNAGEALARLGEPGRLALEQCLTDEDRFARDMAAQWIDDAAAGAVG